MSKWFAMLGEAGQPNPISCSIRLDYSDQVHISIFRYNLIAVVAIYTQMVHFKLISLAQAVSV